MNNETKEAVLKARTLLGDCRRETLFALMSDVKEEQIIRGLLDKLNDLEEKLDDVEDALKSAELPCVRRKL
ncbi:MAG: hypothetical protein P4L67_04360 [Candidatus Pacebacteria bacterium]|nr:hypothetical protein [Candidatus Paceibacterota bacterium]